MPRTPSIPKAFTLIELLVVVAIIAILAAIATPNFLEAQTRSKTARVKSDLRSIVLAIEAYYTDNNAYPQANKNLTDKYLWHLSTPIAYMATSYFKDPFTTTKAAPLDNWHPETYCYAGFYEEGMTDARATDGTVTGAMGSKNNIPAKMLWYYMMSSGPWGGWDEPVTGAQTITASVNYLSPDNAINYLYDPTNGAKSYGQIFRSSGSFAGDCAATARLLTAK